MLQFESLKRSAKICQPLTVIMDRFQRDNDLIICALTTAFAREIAAALVMEL